MTLQRQARSVATSTGLGMVMPANWLRLARLARILSWLTLAWMGVEGGVAIGAAIIAGSTALLGFGLDSGIEAHRQHHRHLAVHRHPSPHSATSERRAQKLVAGKFLPARPLHRHQRPSRALAVGDRAETSIAGLALTAGTTIFEPGARDSQTADRHPARILPPPPGKGTQNLLCAYLAIAVFTGLGANTLFGAWWLDGIVALGIAGWAVIEGRRAWTGYGCACASQPGQPC